MFFSLGELKTQIKNRLSIGPPPVGSPHPLMLDDGMGPLPLTPEHFQRSYVNDDIGITFLNQKPVMTGVTQLQMQIGGQTQ